MKIVLTSIIIGLLLIVLGKTGSELRKISSQSEIIKKEKSKLFGKLELSNKAKTNALDKIDNYKSALEIAKRSTVSLSKNLAMREKSIVDLEFRIQAQHEKYQSLTLKWQKDRYDLLSANKNLKLKLRNLEDVLIEESKKTDNLKTQIANIGKSNRATIKENNRLYALNQVHKQKINNLKKNISELEAENSIFIRSLNSIRKDHSLNTFHLSHHSNNRFEDHDPELSMDRHLPRSFFKYRNLD